MQWPKRQPAFESFFPPIKEKPQNPVSADWLLLFPHGFKVAEANWAGGTSLGRLLHSSAHWPNQQLAMLFAWCYCPDQKLGYGEPLWNFDAIILSVTHRFFVSLPDNEVSCFYSWRSGNKSTLSLGKSILMVNQRGKRDFIHFIARLPRISQTYVDVRVSSSHWQI